MAKGRGPEYRSPKARSAPKVGKPRRWPWIAGALVVLVGLGSLAAHQSLTPHFGRASRAEILAALPPDLAKPEPRDEAAEARFEHLASVLAQAFQKEVVQQEEDEKVYRATGHMPLHAPPTAGEIADFKRRAAAVRLPVRAIINAGPIQAPPTAAPMSGLRWTTDALESDGEILAAARRDDHRRCLNDALWRLRLARAMDGAGRSFNEESTGISGSGPYRREMAVETIYRVEMAGGYDAEGRTRILERLPAQDGPNPALATRVRRMLKEVALPQLFAVGSGTPPWDLPHFEFLHRNQPLERRAGSIDPVATARGMGAYVEARIADLGLPFARRTGRADALKAEMVSRQHEIPEAGVVTDFDSWLAFLAWRDAMNRGANTLGDMWAVECVPLWDDRSKAVAVNLVRAVLLLRSGRTGLPCDPYGKGVLRFDPKRRIVWSVGTNGKDDGGREFEGTERRAMEPELDLIRNY